MQILGEAIEREPESRDAWVNTVCAGDEALRAEITRLLARQESAAQFLEESPLAVAAESNHRSMIGERIGLYRIISQIGRGGMGAVYLAERDDQHFTRRVALKLIKRGMDTDFVVQRFRNERQILASLDHPNIAGLIDGGATEAGLPYLIMEYVEGQPITKYANNHNLTTVERLKLFRTVCSAIQYAHQNLVIHRDLKPSNILVTKAGEPKLLDFGIAKLLQADGGAEPELTATAARVMTPEYASPEQVKGQRVTTSSDVYSLGVLLYELLTGSRPYRVKSRQPEEIAKAICEQEPMKPSQAFGGRWPLIRGNGQSANGKVQSAGTEPITHSAVRNPKLLRGDLDNIVLKALRKEPHRRYASVEQLSEDIRRHLEGLPVTARKDTLAYRTSKFIQRNKIAVSVAALVLVTLVGGIVATTAQRNRAERERLRAEKGEASNHQLLYAAQMSLAYQAWETANVGRTLDLLKAQEPKPGDDDLRGFEWYLLWRLIHERSRILPGPINKVTSVAFSPEGDRVVAASDGKVRVWVSATGQLLKSFDPQVGTVNSAAFSPDGKYLAASFGNGSALIWEAATGQLVRTIKGHKEGIGALAFSPDGRMLATAGDQTASAKIARVWRLDSGREVAILNGHTQYAVSVAFSPDGKTLVTASDDHTAKLWDVASSKEIATLRGHSWYVLGVAFSPEGKILATTGSDGEIKLWDVSSYRETGTIQGDGTTQRGLRFSPDGKMLAVTRDDTTLRIYEVATGKLIDVLRGHTDFVESVAFSPDGKTLASGSFDHSVRLWDLTKHPGTLTLDGHKDLVWNIAFSPDGRTLASASKDATVKLWNAVDGREMMTLRHPQWVNGVAFSPDGTKLATADDDMLLRLWNPATGQNVLTLSGHNVVVECVAFSPDNKLLASGGRTGETKLWDAATGREIASLHSPNKNLIWSLAFSPDGKYLAIAEGGMEALGLATGHLVTVWDVASRQIVRTLAAHSNDVRAVAFSPDGRFLASGSYDATIRFWDAATWQEIVTLKSHKIQSLAFSTDGERLVSGGRDKTVRLWDIATRQELCTLTTPGEVNSVAFSPDNKVLAAASNDNKVRLWFAATKDEAGQ